MEIQHEPLEGLDDFYEQQIAPHILAGMGALINGSAGTGESHVLGRIEEDLKAQGHEVRKVCLTQVACRRLGDAKTVQSFIHRHVLHGRFRWWLLVDEVCMLPALFVTLVVALELSFVCISEPSRLRLYLNTVCCLKKKN